MDAAIEEVSSAAPGRADRLTPARAARIGWGVWVFGLILRLGELWIASRPVPTGAHAFGLDLGTHLAAAGLGTTAATVGAIIVARRPRNLVGWLTLFGGLVQAVIGVTNAYAARSLAAGVSNPVAALAWLDGIALQVVPIAVVAAVVAVFPTGHLASPRWRALAFALGAGAVLRAAEVGFGLDHLFLVPSVANPFRATGTVGDVLGHSNALGVGLIVLGVSSLAAAVSMTLRYRTAEFDARQQIRWILVASIAAVVAAVPFAVLSVVGNVDPSRTGWALTLVFLGANLVPLALLVAITRYRLYEIDRIINRTVLYGLLTAILAGVFTAGIGLAQRLFVTFTRESSDAAVVLTTLVVATLYAPLRKRLEGVIDRRFKFEQLRFGEYHDELQRLLSLTDPRFAARRLVTEAVRELGAAGGAILNARGGVTASAGRWPLEPALRVSLPGAHPSTTELALGARTDGQPFRAEALQALEELAPLAARAMTGAPPSTRHSA